MLYSFIELLINTIGIFEVETHFTKLIQRVQDGEEFLITKRGTPVAKIISLEKDIDQISINNAINRIKKLSKEMCLGEFNWQEWKLYKDEGRR